MTQYYIKGESIIDKGIIGEFRGCELGDKRLNKRLEKTADVLFNKLGASIPSASENWATTKAIYRFLDNPNFAEDKLIQRHFEATAQRFHEYKGGVLVLHDTTELTYHRKTNTIGNLKRVFVQKKPRDLKVTIQGLLFHTSLVVTLEGLPIGISAIKLWTRKKFKGTRELKSHINPTRVPIEQKESFRWIENIRQTNDLLSIPENCVHIGDREADIFELFSECQKSQSSFVVRLDINRRIDGPSKTLFESTHAEPQKGEYTVTLTDKGGKNEEICVEVRFKQVTVLSPIGKEKKYPDPIRGYFIEVTEKGTNTPRIEWKLLTNTPVNSFAEACEKIQWYAMRWKIEMFFKILKSGCKTEQSKLRSAERLAKFITLCSVIAWKVFWLTMLNRTNPESDAISVLSDMECNVIKYYKKEKDPLWNGNTVTDYVVAIAQLGGYLNRNGDPPPGNMVVWKGYSRLYDILTGFIIATKVMGN